MASDCNETQLLHPPPGPPASSSFQQAYPIVCSNLGGTGWCSAARLACRAVRQAHDDACCVVRLPLANDDTLRALGSPVRGPLVTHKDIARLLSKVKPRALYVYAQGASKIETLVTACSSPACAAVEELRIFGSMRLSASSGPGSVAARLAAALPNLRRLTIATDSLLDTGAHLRQTEPLPAAISLLSPSASACSSLSAAGASGDAAGAFSPRACGTPRGNFIGPEFSGPGADADSGLDADCGGVGASMEVWLLRLLGPRLQSLTLQPLVREMAAGAPGGAIHYLPLASADAFSTSQDPESSPLWTALCSLKGLRELDLGCQMLPAWLFPAVPRPPPPPRGGGAASTPAAWRPAAVGASGSAGACGGSRSGVCVQSWVRMALSGSAASGSGPGPSSSGDYDYYDYGCSTEGDTSEDEVEELTSAAGCGGLAAVWPHLTRLAAGGILGLASPNDEALHEDGYGGGAPPSGLALPPRGFRQLQLREPQSVAALAAVYRASAAAEALVAAAEARAAAAEARGGLRPRQLWAAAAAEGFSLGATTRGGYCHGGAADASGTGTWPFAAPGACLYGEPLVAATALGQGYEPDSPAVLVAAAAAAGTSSCPASPAAAAKAAQSGIHAPCSASCSSCAAALASTLGVLGQVAGRAPGGGGLAARPNVLLLHTSHIAPWPQDGHGVSGASPLSSLSESPGTESQPHQHQRHVTRLQHNHPQHPQQPRPRQQQAQRPALSQRQHQHQQQHTQRSRDQSAQAAAMPTAAAADAAAAALAKWLRERNTARRPSVAPHLPTHNEDEEGERHKRRQQQHSFFSATRGPQRGSIDSSEAFSSDEDRGDDNDEEQERSNEPEAQPRHDLMAGAVALLVRGGGRCRALTIRMSESPAAAGVTAGAAGAPAAGAAAGGGGSCCAGSFWRYGCRAAEGPHKPWLAALAPLDAAGLRSLTLCCFSFSPGDMTTLAAALPGLRDGGCLILEHCPLPPCAAAELRCFAEVRCRGLPPPQPLLLSQRSQPQLALTQAAQELQDQLTLLRLRRSTSGTRYNAAGTSDTDALSAAVAAASAARFGGSAEGREAAPAPVAVTKPGGKGAGDDEDEDDKHTWSRVRVAPWVEAAEARARAGRQAAAAAAAAALSVPDTNVTGGAAAPGSATACVTASSQAARMKEAVPLQISDTPTSCYSASSDSASSASHTGPAGGSGGTGEGWGRPLKPRGRWQSDCGVSAAAAPPLPLLGSGGVHPCAAAAAAIAVDAAERCGGKQQCAGRAGDTCVDSAPAYASSCTLACADSIGERGAAQQHGAERQGGSGALGASGISSGGSGSSSAARVRRPAGNLALALRASASSQRRRAGAAASPGN